MADSDSKRRKFSNKISPDDHRDGGGECSRKFDDKDRKGAVNEDTSPFRKRATSSDSEERFSESGETAGDRVEDSIAEEDLYNTQELVDEDERYGERKRRGKKILRERDNVGYVVEDAPDMDEMSDIDNLRQFTIPKMKASKNGLFEEISLESQLCQHDIIKVIQDSFKNRNNVTAFVISSPFLVRNNALLTEYTAKRKIMKQSRSDKDQPDTFAFLRVNSHSEVKKLCTEGAKIGNSSLKCLGNPSMGVYLCRHADIIQPMPLTRGQTGFLILFKVIKGRVKLVVEKNDDGDPLDPPPQADCLQSNKINIDLNSVTPLDAFKSTQIYLYEYTEDFDIVARPRQICPFAVVSFKYSPTKSSSSSLLGRPSSSRHLPYYVNRATQGNDIRDASQQNVDSGVVAGGGGGRLKSQSLVDPLRQLTSVVGQRVDNGGVVIWVGRICKHCAVMFDVYLVTFSLVSFPVGHLGSRLVLKDSDMSGSLEERFLVDVPALLPHTEYYSPSSGLFYNYAELHPVKEDQGRFNQIMTLMSKSDQSLSVIECQLSDNKGEHCHLAPGVDLLIFTNCQTTRRLGLSEAHCHPLLLHCIFVTSQSCIMERYSADERSHGTVGLPLLSSMFQNVGAHQWPSNSSPLSVGIPAPSQLQETTASTVVGLHNVDSGITHYPPARLGYVPTALQPTDEFENYDSNAMQNQLEPDIDDCPAGPPSPSLGLLTSNGLRSRPQPVEYIPSVLHSSLDERIIRMQSNVDDSNERYPRSRHAEYSPCFSPNTSVEEEEECDEEDENDDDSSSSEELQSDLELGIIKLRVPTASLDRRDDSVPKPQNSSESLREGSRAKETRHISDVPELDLHMSDDLVDEIVRIRPMISKSSKQYSPCNSIDELRYDSATESVGSRSSNLAENYGNLKSAASITPSGLDSSVQRTALAVDASRSSVKRPHVEISCDRTSSISLRASSDTDLLLRETSNSKRLRLDEKAVVGETAPGTQSPLNSSERPVRSSSSTNVSLRRDITADDTLSSVTCKHDVSKREHLHITSVSNETAVTNGDKISHVGTALDNNILTTLAKSLVKETILGAAGKAFESVVNLNSSKTAKTSVDVATRSSNEAATVARQNLDSNASQSSKVDGAATHSRSRISPTSCGNNNTNNNNVNNVSNKSSSSKNSPRDDCALPSRSSHDSRLDYDRMRNLNICFTIEGSRSTVLRDERLTAAVLSRPFGGESLTTASCKKQSGDSLSGTSAAARNLEDISSISDIVSLVLHTGYKPTALSCAGQGLVSTGLDDREAVSQPRSASKSRRSTVTEADDYQMELLWMFGLHFLPFFVTEELLDERQVERNGSGNASEGRSATMDVTETGGQITVITGQVSRSVADDHHVECERKHSTDVELYDSLNPLHAATNVRAATAFPLVSPYSHVLLSSTPSSHETNNYVQMYGNDYATDAGRYVTLDRVPGLDSSQQYGSIPKMVPAPFGSRLVMAARPYELTSPVMIPQPYRPTPAMVPSLHHFFTTFVSTPYISGPVMAPVPNGTRPVMVPVPYSLGPAAPGRYGSSPFPLLYGSRSVMSPGTYMSGPVMGPLPYRSRMIMAPLPYRSRSVMFPPPHVIVPEPYNISRVETEAETLDVVQEPYVLRTNTEIAMSMPSCEKAVDVVTRVDSGPLPTSATLVPYIDSEESETAPTTDALPAATDVLPVPTDDDELLSIGNKMKLMRELTAKLLFRSGSSMVVGERCQSRWNESDTLHSPRTLLTADSEREMKEKHSCGTKGRSSSKLRSSRSHSRVSSRVTKISKGRARSRTPLSGNECRRESKIKSDITSRDRSRSRNSGSSIGDTSRRASGDRSRSRNSGSITDRSRKASRDQSRSRSSSRSSGRRVSISCEDRSTSRRRSVSKSLSSSRYFKRRYSISNNSRQAISIRSKDSSRSVSRRSRSISIRNRSRSRTWSRRRSRRHSDNSGQSRSRSKSKISGHQRSSRRRRRCSRFVAGRNVFHSRSSTAPSSRNPSQARTIARSRSRRSTSKISTGSSSGLSSGAGRHSVQRRRRRRRRSRNRSMSPRCRSTPTISPSGSSGLNHADQFDKHERRSRNRSVRRRRWKSAQRNRTKCARDGSADAGRVRYGWARGGATAHMGKRGRSSDMQQSDCDHSGRAPGYRFIDERSQSFRARETDAFYEIYGRYSNDMETMMRNLTTQNFRSRVNAPLLQHIFSHQRSNSARFDGSRRSRSPAPAIRIDNCACGESEPTTFEFTETVTSESEEEGELPYSASDVALFRERQILSEQYDLIITSSANTRRDSADKSGPSSSLKNV